ncbi:LysE family translocator [Bosea sp. PAMC 26642]|uniref:LysE family translocator n=1 Tax=Bosea sp. (strain PAMC 26642) TaxID=1792307 RepID=UPI000770542B|nr:LysE family transporter [Bosea sp. PAMC 26642]AMJ62443.1 hypothetical protein AXW83_20980 [Bosea sp. PAMC 26642]
MFNSDIKIIIMQISSLAIPYAFMLVSPGPNLLVVLRVGLASSVARPLAAALGIACGATIAAAIAVQGSALIDRTDQLEILFSLIFAAMLVRSAIRLLQQAQKSDVELQRNSVKRISQAFALGMVASLSNPITIPFFFSFFIANPKIGSSGETACAIVFVMAVSWFSFIGIFCNYFSRRKTGLFLYPYIRTALAVGMVFYAVYIIVNVLLKSIQ